MFECWVLCLSSEAIWLSSGVPCLNSDDIWLSSGVQCLSSEDIWLSSGTRIVLHITYAEGSQQARLYMFEYPRPVVPSFYVLTGRGYSNRANILHTGPGTC